MSTKTKRITEPRKITGSRAEVYHGTAERTTGGLRACDLFRDRYGYIRSVRRSRQIKERNKSLDEFTQRINTMTAAVFEAAEKNVSSVDQTTDGYQQHSNQPE